MIIKAIIQSRMTSNRFPGKMLASFHGKPLLAHVVDRIKKTKVNKSIVLATSNDHADDPLAVYGEHLGLKVVRGARDDVFGRFAGALSEHKCEAFFRICGDSPLLLPFLFDKAISIYKNSSFDLVTNVFPRTFPTGMSIELIRTKTFFNIKKRVVNKNEKEHMTKFFYQNSNEFKIYNIECAKSIDPNLRLAVDELQDIKRIEAWSLSKKKEYEDLFPIQSIKQLVK